MTPELWLAAAACLLGLAFLASGLAIFKVSGPWNLLALVFRALGALAVCISLISTLALRGEWSPADRQQLALGLAVSMLLIHLLLAARLPAGGAGPLVDLGGLALVLAAAFVLPSDAPPLTCAQRGTPFLLQWLLSLFGGGSMLVAGNAGMMLVLCKGMARLGWRVQLPGHADWYWLLTQATFLALFVAGCGLTVGAWWAWKTVGMWTSGDPREGWMVVAWLVSAMGLSAWQLERRRGSWAVALATAAAAMILLGFLALPQVLLAI